MKFPVNYKIMSKFFILMIVIVVIFSLFAMFSKTGADRNLEEQESYSEKVLTTYESMELGKITESEFISDKSTFKKKINVTSKTETINGIYVYKIQSEHFLKIYWHKNNNEEIQIEKFVIK